MKVSTCIILFVVAILLIGCGSAKRNVTIVKNYEDDPIWSQVKPKEIKEIKLYNGDLRQKYIEVAEITVDSIGTSLDPTYDRMKEEAAKLGVDAVIKIHVSKKAEGSTTRYNPYTKTYESDDSERHYMTGTAVIFSPQPTK